MEDELRNYLEQIVHIETDGRALNREPDSREDYIRRVAVLNENFIMLRPYVINYNDQSALKDDLKYLKDFETAQSLRDLEEVSRLREYGARSEITLHKNLIATIALAEDKMDEGN